MNIRTRQTLTRLGAAYALAWATTSMGAGPGSAAVVTLSGNLAWAGMYVAIFNIGAATGAALGGRSMDRYGRKPPLVAGYLLGAVGYLVAGLGVRASSLATFVIGGLMLAAAFGIANLSRLAVAEMFPPAERGRGVAWIQIAAIFGAIAGPLILIASEPIGRLLGGNPLTLIWFFAPPLLLMSAFLVTRAEEPQRLAFRSPQHVSDQTDVGSVVEQKRAITAGTVSIAASQSSMAAVMGVGGAAVAHAGHGVPVLGTIMLLHFIGMFGLSRVVGRFADRVGRIETILAGLALLASGGAIIGFIPGMVAFGIGLLLVGFGWSFSFIGATVLLTDAALPERRARTLGRADLSGQLCSVVIATAGGWWFASRGAAGLGVLAMVVAATPVILLTRLREPRLAQS
ncbi:MAG TPA: MFS transporter [Gemmatimonadaceae bacterium]